MKNVKLVIPVLAFLFAVVTAFATSSNTSVIDDPRVDDADVSGCADIGKCIVSATNTCADEQYQLYTNSTTCGGQLSGEFVAE